MNNAADIYFPGGQTHHRPLATSPKAKDRLLSKVN